jgi:hypothetical protein
MIKSVRAVEGRLFVCLFLQQVVPGKLCYFNQNRNYWKI